MTKQCTGCGKELSATFQGSMCFGCVTEFASGRNTVKFPFTDRVNEHLSKETKMIEDHLKIKIAEMQLDLAKKYKGMAFRLELPYLYCKYMDQEAIFNLQTLKWTAVIDDLEDFFCI